jgi:hypothetical protein
MTKFLILAQTSTIPVEDGRPQGDLLWQEVATVEAASKDAALRSIGGNAGTYVAVPVRSWQPVRLEVETVQRTRLSAASINDRTRLVGEKGPEAVPAVGQEARAAEA